MMEWLADIWGRQIRYGEEPDDPERRLKSMTRSEVVTEVRRIADLETSLEAMGSAAKAALQAGAPAEDVRLDVALQTAEQVKEMLARVKYELQGGLT